VPRQFSDIVGQFIWLGMMHIWTGYDHILFLLSVILLVRSVKKILLLVSSFTVAHSITLILASYYSVAFLSVFAEPLIALSIVYVAGRNMWGLYQGWESEQVGERVSVAFGFGLIHGLGFAGALMVENIPTAFFIPTLLVFNIGIELGQLTTLAIAVPILLWIDKQPYARRLLMGASFVVFCLALFWFFQRI
jgi:hypothetical protein